MDRKRALAWAGATSATALSGALAAGAVLGLLDDGPAAARQPMVTETKTRAPEKPTSLAQPGRALTHIVKGTPPSTSAAASPSSPAAHKKHERVHHRGKRGRGKGHHHG